MPDDVGALEEALSCCEQAARRYPARSRWIELARLYGDAGREADAQRATMHRLLALTCPE
ncbi:hypothetical protein [Roseiflexus sp. RS-1]|uniref:hypothetical protein n=1 Tax=Roseiflexus sp. (strain RS-1) TaxID=357808 RepID=UPI0002FCBF3C|nr:hypothetical protein [Roseiflexus sp. RS-1]